MLVMIEKDCIILTHIVLPQGCTSSGMHMTTYTCMQMSQLAITGYHLAFSLYDNICIGVALNTCAWLMADLLFITHHGRC